MTLCSLPWKVAVGRARRPCRSASQMSSLRAAPTYKPRQGSSGGIVMATPAMPTDTENFALMARMDGRRAGCWVGGCYSCKTSDRLRAATTRENVLI